MREAELIFEAGKEAAVEVLLEKYTRIESNTQQVITLFNSVEDLKVLLPDMDARFPVRMELLEERIRFFRKELLGRKTDKRAPEEGSISSILSTKRKCSPRESRSENLWWCKTTHTRDPNAIISPTSSPVRM